MRKNILGAIAASALALCGTANAGLVLNLNGSSASQIQADGLDWAPTSFLAQGGNSAISSFADPTNPNHACAAAGTCFFNVLTQAVLTGYKPTGGSTFGPLPASTGQITLVASYQERVTSFLGGATPLATFASTGMGMLEFYYNPLGNANDLTGSGFNAGRLIGRLTGVTPNAAGLFSITDPTPVPLDAAPPNPPGDQYPGQLTVTGIGTQATLFAGTSSVVLDPSFFLTAITGFSINFTNISIGLPYTTVKPADCFNTTETAIAVTTSGLASQCNTNHTLGPYSAQITPTGYLPVVGAVNGLGLGAPPDFVAQTDFNSAVIGGPTVPEPGTLALVGLALGSMAFVAKRRRT